MGNDEIESSDRSVTIDANGHRVPIACWSTCDEGLVAHPMIVEVDVEGTGEVKFAPTGWVLTHVQSGAAVIQRHDAVKSLIQARMVADELHQIGTWTDPNPAATVSYERVKEAINTVVEHQRRRDQVYAVRPVVHGYAIIRLKDEEEVEVHPHRGIAGRRKRELEEGQE